MKLSHSLQTLLLVLLFCTNLPAQKDKLVKELESFLQTSSLSELKQFEQSKTALSKSQANAVTELLVAKRLEEFKSEFGQQWKDKVIRLDKQEMKFEYKVFGDKPDTGRSLFISMHGGGGAPARVNDQQWRNQIGLYEPKEGVYLAPRAPTNTWNLWHQGHIDPMFARIIVLAMAYEDVDLNKVYLMGYSAGGDGVYQLAPRMADQLAAAAMMAGHPNDAQPLGLRNIGFTLHMGGKDSAYNRNGIAREWKKKLADLKEADPDGYEHEVVIHEQYGHWMQRDDAIAVPWMAKFERDPFPSKVIWFQSGVTHDRFYWLAVDQENKKRGTHIVVTRSGQKFIVEKADGVEQFVIRLNDQMVNLNQEIVVNDAEGNTLFAGKPNRTIQTIANTLMERFDPKSNYSAEVTIELSK